MDFIHVFPGLDHTDIASDLDPILWKVDMAPLSAACCSNPLQTITIRRGQWTNNANHRSAGELEQELCFSSNLVLFSQGKSCAGPVSEQLHCKAPGVLVDRTLNISDL